MFLRKCLCFNVYTIEGEGNLQTYWKNGQLKSEVNYVGYVREGISKKYHENGQLRSEVNYINGLREGISKKYHENGQLMLHM